MADLSPRLLHVAPERCPGCMSLRFLRGQCQPCPPVSLPRVPPLLSQRKFLWSLFSDEMFDVLCTPVIPPSFVTLKFLLKKREENPFLAFQHLFNFAFQPRQLTFTFILCPIGRAPKALNSFFIFRKTSIKFTYH